MEVSLMVVEGRPLGAVIPLKTKRFVIGRDASCQLRPKSQTVSNHHCVLTRRNDHVTISDLGSTNGTLVNDRCLHRGEEIRVCDGDRLQVGQLIFAVRITSEAPAEAASSWEGVLGGAESGLHDNPMSHTMMIGSPIPAAAPRAPAGSSRVGSPDPGAAAQFAYRKVDSARHATVLGLSPDQVTDEAAFRTTRKALLALASRPQSKRLVLDLGAVADLPSGACALLLALADGCRIAGGELRLGGAAPDLKDLLTALKLDSRIECYDEPGQALAEAWD